MPQNPQPGSSDRLSTVPACPGSSDVASSSLAGAPGLVTSAAKSKELYSDLGTDTGWAIRQNGVILRSGTLILATDEELEAQRRQGRDRTLDIRFVRFFRWLLEQIFDGVRRIVFEDVGFASTRMASHLWASSRAAIWAVGVLHPEVEILCVPVGTLKQFATGDSTAQKIDMANALASRRPADYKLVEGGQIRKSDGALADHNEVDAIWLALYAEAVERGERAFLSVYQRKQIKADERKRKRSLRREKARLKRAAQSAQEKAKQRAVRIALKSLGPCCGVFRKRDRHLAVCPKCGRRVALPKIQISSPPGEPSPVHIPKISAVLTSQLGEPDSTVPLHKAQQCSAQADSQIDSKAIKPPDLAT